MNPQMPEKLDTAYENLTNAAMNLARWFLWLEDYGLARNVIYAEFEVRVWQRMQEIRPDQVFRTANAALSLRDSFDPAPTADRLRARLERARHETGARSVNCTVMLRGAPGELTGVVTDDGRGFKMMCPAAKPSPAARLAQDAEMVEVYFDGLDILAVAFPVKVTVDGTKIHVSS
jgi:hypothetical protein